MAQFTVIALIAVAGSIGIAALVVLWQILGAVAGPPNQTDDPDRS